MLIQTVQHSMAASGISCFAIFVITGPLTSHGNERKHQDHKHTEHSLPLASGCLWHYGCRHAFLPCLEITGLQQIDFWY